MARILVTPRSLTSDPPALLEPLRAAGHELFFSAAGLTPGEDELLALVPEADGWLAGVEPVSPAVIGAARRLRVISRNGTGTDNLPMAELEARGIHVARAPAANANGVAELTVGLMLAACRNLFDVASGVREGGWPRPRGREIEGARVGIVGAGAIGRKVAGVLGQLGAGILFHDPFHPDLGALAERAAYVELDELVERADIVTLHCPMPPDGLPLLDAAAFARMARGAILVNTARAGLVDEAALAAALDSGHLSAYATDVFTAEPPAPGGLAAHPRVLATSHIGGLTEESVRRATEAAVANLLLALGEPSRATP